MEQHNHSNNPIGCEFTEEILMIKAYSTHHSKGVQLYKEQHYEEALDEFTEAVDIVSG